MLSYRPHAQANVNVKTAAAHLHAVGTAVPANDIHRAFVDWATAQLADPRHQAIFRRMAARSGIEHRWSVLPRTEEGGTPLGAGGFYAGNRFPPTSKRMAWYADYAPSLAMDAIAALREKAPLDGITHLIVASCTGFVAPGIDQIIVERLELDADVERTVIGFMGCYAAVAALRVAHHIARSVPGARILVVTVELSTLHLTNAHDLESLLAMLQFGDGAAAAIVSAEPSSVALDRFFAGALPNSRELIQWTIGDEGFEMTLSGEVPNRIVEALRSLKMREKVLQGRSANDVSWAVHAGGRSILDAVESGLDMPSGTLATSRSVLARFGNMSSATLMFVLEDLMEQTDFSDGIALAFGPGIAAEGFSFHHVQ